MPLFSTILINDLKLHAKRLARYIDRVQVCIPGTSTSSVCDVTEPDIYDVSTSNVVTGGTTFKTWTHTTSDRVHRYLVLTIEIPFISPVAAPPAVSYDGVAMTMLIQQNVTTNVGVCYIYGLPSPHVGSHTVSVNFGVVPGMPDWIATALGHAGIDLSNPIDDIQGSTGTTSGGNQNAYVAIGIFPPRFPLLVLAGAINSFPVATPQPGLTAIQTDQVNTGLAKVGGYPFPDPLPIVTGWENIATGKDWAVAAVALNTYQGADPCHFPCGTTATRDVYAFTCSRGDFDAGTSSSTSTSSAPRSCMHTRHRARIETGARVGRYIDDMPYFIEDFGTVPAHVFGYAHDCGWKCKHNRPMPGNPPLERTCYPCEYHMARMIGVYTYANNEHYGKPIYGVADCSKCGDNCCVPPQSKLKERLFATVTYCGGGTRCGNALVELDLNSNTIDCEDPFVTCPRIGAQWNGSSDVFDPGDGGPLVVFNITLKCVTSSTSGEVDEWQLYMLISSSQGVVGGSFIVPDSGQCDPFQWFWHCRGWDQGTQCYNPPMTIGAGYIIEVTE